MNAVRRTLVLAAGLIVALTLGGCSSSGNDCGKNPAGPGCVTTTTLPPVQACTQTVVESGTGSVSASSLYYNDFSVSDTGRLDTTIDWTNASSKIGIYLVPVNSCTLDQFNARSCTFLMRSEPSSIKPRKVSTTNFAAGNYRWLIANFSDSDESVSFQFVLSKGSCAAVTGGQAAPFSADGRAVRKAIHF